MRADVPDEPPPAEPAEPAERAGYDAFAAAAWPGLVRSAVFLGCRVHEAEDVAQTALVRCYTSWPAVSGAEDRTAYVYRVLVNCLRDSRRRRWWGERPTERLPEDVSRPDGHVPDTTTTVDTADAVHRAIACLSKPHRDVVVLRHLVGLTELQTSRVLGVPTGTVKSRLSRALAQLAASHHLTDPTPHPTPDPTPERTHP